jgi:elongation factor G
MTDDTNRCPLLLEIAIEPKSKVDEQKLRVALAKLVAEDPSFGVTTDEESGQTIIKGTSESQLDAKLNILESTYNIDADIGPAQVAYREKITHSATVDFTYKKQTRGHRQFAHVKLVAAPTEPGAGFTFANEMVGGSVPKEFIPAIKRGVENMMGLGVVAGFPVVDVNVSLIGGASHDVDSSSMAFENCARAAMREALQKGDSVLLEPIMKVEIVTPEDYASTIIGDLNSRRGSIQCQDLRDDSNVVIAMVPLANMFSYVNSLRTISGGRATFTMQFNHYARLLCRKTIRRFVPQLECARECPIG